MAHRLLIPLIALGAVALLVTGVVAGMLLSEDTGSDRRSTPSSPSGTDGEAAYLGLSVSVIGGNGGLRVSSVDPGSPADEAGIDVGDVLRSVDGLVVRTPEQLRSAVETHRPGDRVSITYERSDREARADVELAGQPANAQGGATATPSTTATPSAQAQGQSARGGRLGITVQQNSPALKQHYNLTREDGLVVTEVMPNSTASRAGLHTGDVILSVNSTSVSTPGELQRALIRIGSNEMAAINIQRTDEQLTIETRLPPQGNLDGISGLIPDDLRRLLQEAIDSGTLAPEQLQNFLRLYQTRGDFVTVGRVKSVDPGIVQETWTVTVAPVNGASEVAVNVNGRTEIKRGAASIQTDDLKENELIIAITLDANRTATQIIATGSTD